jgi:pimeloyl-ACP methyl ester carboxylesterase
MSVLFRTAFAIALVAVAVLYAPALLNRDEYHPTTHEFTSRLSHRRGQLVNTSLGQVHYWTRGDASHPLCVVMHGISVSSATMEPVVDALVARGVRTIAFDFFGRGHSTALPASTAYTNDVYVQTVVELLDAVGLARTPVHIAAMSMAGAVAAIFAARHPDRVLSLSLLAPAGVPFKMPLAGELLRVEPLGRSLITSPLGKYMLMSRIPASFVEPDRNALWVDNLRQELAFHLAKPGFAHAFSSTVSRFDALHNATEFFAAVGKLHKGCATVFWGQQDKTVPIAPGAELLRKLVPHISLHRFANTGHSLHLERTDVIADNIVKCIGGKHAAATVTEHN